MPELAALSEKWLVGKIKHKKDCDIHDMTVMGIKRSTDAVKGRGIDLCDGCQGDTYFLKVFIDNKDPDGNLKKQQEPYLAGDKKQDGKVPYGETYCYDCCVKLF